MHYFFTALLYPPVFNSNIILQLLQTTDTKQKTKIIFQITC